MNLLFLLFPLVPITLAADGANTSTEKPADKTVKKAQTSKAQQPAAQPVGYQSHSLINSTNIKNDGGYDFVDESGEKNIQVSIEAGFAQSTPYVLSNIKSEVEYNKETNEDDGNTIPTDVSVTTSGKKYGNIIKNGTNSSASSKADDESNATGSSSGSGSSSSASGATTGYSIAKGFRPRVGIKLEAVGESVSGGLGIYSTFSKGSVGQVVRTQTNSKIKSSSTEIDMSGKKYEYEVVQENEKPSFGAELSVKKQLSGNDESALIFSLVAKGGVEYTPAKAVKINITESKSSTPLDGTGHMTTAVGGKYTNDKGIFLSRIGIGAEVDMKMNGFFSFIGGAGISYNKTFSDVTFSRKSESTDIAGISSVKSTLTAGASGLSVDVKAGLNYRI